MECVVTYEEGDTIQYTKSDIRGFIVVPDSGYLSEGLYCTTISKHYVYPVQKLLSCRMVLTEKKRRWGKKK